MLLRFTITFVALFLLSFSFPRSYIPNVGQYTSPYFEIPVQWTSKYIFNISEPYTTQLISDSTGLYVHVFLLIFYAIILTSLWMLIDKNNERHKKLSYWFSVVCSYYLALQMLYYGFNKVFKWQFYIPEPNTLFTSVGQTYPDLLFWSAMGMSWSYTVFGGLLEVFAGALLLFKPTRLLGALVSIGVLSNVLMINMGFGVSVKVLSFFLLFLSIVIAAPHAKRLYQFFIKNNPIPDTQWQPNYSVKKHHSIYLITKTLVIWILLFEVLAPYFESNNFNDDTYPRPPYHGAYEVNTFVFNGDTLAPLTTDENRWRRVFIHRRAYLITQMMNDKMKDYRLSQDVANDAFVLEKYGNKNYGLVYYNQPNDSTFILNGIVGKDSIRAEMNKIDLSQLPLMKEEFHWTIDD